MAKKKDKKFIDFPKIYDSSVKEIFTKERKYDSVYNEYKRVYQNGKSIKINYSGSLETLLVKIVLKSFSSSKFKVQKDDLVKWNIIYLYDKKNNPIDRIRIIKFDNEKKESIFTFQSVSEAGEIRTTIRIYRSNFFKRNKKVIVSFEQLFKREESFYGLKDEFRKRLIGKQIAHRAAILFEQLKKSGYYKKDKLPGWAEKTLRLNRKRKYISLK